jgi:hypothetical protein
MKIIELKGDIYDVLSDGVAGENCIVYHNGTANVFSNMERIYHSPNFTNSEVLGEIRTQVVSTENFDSRYGGQNSLVSSDMKRVQDFSRTKVFDDIVGDLKIDALYIFDKALLTTHHFVVLKMII